MDESQDVSFYVFAEPALSAPEPEDWNIWHETAQLRTENLRWRDCITAIVRDVDHYSNSADALRQAISKHVTELGAQLADLYRNNRVTPRNVGGDF